MPPFARADASSAFGFGRARANTNVAPHASEARAYRLTTRKATLSSMRAKVVHMY
jgi:hypothetical protein